jgi:hypothetical protein
MKRSLISLVSPQNLIGLISLVGMVTFWIYTQSNLPKRVDNCEIRLTTLERDFIDSKARQELMLQAIYETRADVKQLMRDIKR